MNQRRFIAGILGLLLMSQASFSAGSSRSRLPARSKKKAPSAQKVTAAERRLRRSMSPAPTFGLKDSLSTQSSARAVRLPQGLVISAPKGGAATPAGSATGAIAPTKSTAVLRSGVPPKHRVNVGGTLSLGYETSLHEAGAAEASRALSLETALWARVAEGWRADALVSGGKFVTGERQSQLQAAAVGILHDPWRLTRSLRFRPRLVYNLPTFNEASRAATSRGGLALQGRLLFTPEALPSLTSFYQVSVLRNVYQYTTRADGEANVAWVLAHRLVLDWSLSDALSFQLSPGISTGYTFEGTPSSSFRHGEELSYAFSPVWSLALGHQNEGAFYRENGRDVNFSVVNGQTSTVYISLTNQF